MPNLPLDDSRNPITNFDNGIIVEAKVDYGLGNTGATTSSPFDIFTVTGVNIVNKIWGACTTDLAGANAVVSVGMGGSGESAFLLGELTATNVDAGELWTGEGAEAATSPSLIAIDSSTFTQSIIADGEDIVGSVDTADVTSGVVTFYCLYVPISDGASITAADAAA